MKRYPWLIIGTLIGAFVGELVTPARQQGWEREWHWLRPVYGAFAGLGCGLMRTCYPRIAASNRLEQNVLPNDPMLFRWFVIVRIYFAIV
jgi:hypothetical protein